MLFCKLHSFKFWIIVCSLSTHFIDATPSGFSVISGDASPPVQTDGTLVIESSSNAVVDWESFSIDLNETIVFQQPGQNHYILNRVRGGEESSILGALQSNGAIYLVNPNGIVIGQDALIETAGFIASTLDLAKRDLNVNVFEGESHQSVVNRGKIRCPFGNVYLIARHVEQSGSIFTPQGQQGLLSGSDVVISLEGAPQVLIRSNEPIDLNLIEENPYALAIKHSGYSEGEQIYLIAADGRCEFKGEIVAEQNEKGGVVQIFGDEVALFDGASVNASGKRGGGEVLIGGDYQGDNPKIKNAKQVWVSSKSEVNVDASDIGSGGKVVFWADQKMQFSGVVSAQGGANGGDGGFVEVSGSELQFEGKVNTFAPHGNTGMLLLDPTDITITSADSGGSFGGCISGTNTFTPSGNTNTISATTLAGLLNAPCSVTISTSSGGAGTNGGSITVSSAVSWSAASTLTLTANSFISVTAAITNTSASTGFNAMNFTASGVGATTNPGILLGSGGVLTTTGGDIVLNGTSSATTTASYGISINGGSIVTGSGNISATGVVPTGSTSANIFGLYMHTANGITSTSGNITLSGTTNSAGTNCNGILVDVLWSSLTTGTLTFNNCAGGSGTNAHGVNTSNDITASGPIVFSNCLGGTGGGNGININSTVTTNNNFIATTNIVGRGSSGIGAFIRNNGTIYVSGTNHSIKITASSIGTSSGCHGIRIDGFLQTVGVGAGNTGVLLIGTSSPSASTASYGTYITGQGLIFTGDDDTYISGLSLAGTSSSGTSIATGTSPLLSSTGNFFISGNSTSNSTDCHGVRIAGSIDSNTTGTITFGAQIPGGVQGCIGGSGTLSNGINIGLSISAVGSIVATNSILSGTGSGSVGVNSVSNVQVTGSNSSIQITALSQAILGAAHGISGGTYSSVNGSINLNGTAGASTTAASHGINLTGAVTSSGSGNITLTGTAPSSNQSCYGVNVGASISSSSGTVTCTGTSSASGSGSYGINVGTAWSAGNATALSLTGTGGSGSASHGIRLGASLICTGSITLNGTAGGGAGSFANSFSSSITTRGGNIAINGNAILAGNSTVDATNSGSTATGASISFSSTIDGTAANNQTLILLAGSTGAVTLSGAIGSTTALGSFTITNAKTTLNAVNIGANITAAAFTITSASPATLLNSIVINTSGATGGAISIGGRIDATSSGSQALTLTANGTGSVTLNGDIGASTRLGAIIVSSGSGSLSIGTGVTGVVANSFTVAGSVPTTLNNSGLLTINTSAFSGGGISFGGTINGAVAGSQALTLTAGTGSITLSGNVGGSARLGAMIVSSGSGGVSIGTGMTTIAANSFTVSGSVPITLNNMGTLTINTSAFGGNISFGDSINGATSYGQNLTLNSGSGNIILSGAVGNISGLGGLVFSGALDVTVSSTLAAASLTQSAGTGTTTFNSSLLLVSDIALTGNNFTFNAPVLSATSVTINNSGLLSISSSGSMSITGPFLQSGIGLVETAGNITTTNTDIEFNSGVTLTGDLVLDTSGSVGDITFINTINGGSDLTLSARDITFGAAVGTTPLTSLQVSASGVINIGADQTVSTGPMSYSGAVVLTGNVEFIDQGVNGITFQDTVTGNHNLTLSSSASSITVNGNIDLSGSTGSNGGNLLATSYSHSTYGGQILIKGGNNGAGIGGAGGDLSLISNTGSVSVHNINASGGNGSVAGGSGGNITLQAANTYSGNYPDGLIVLNADLSGGAEGNLVSLAGAGGGANGGIITLSSNRSSSAAVATITSSLGGNNISISADQIVMGNYEAMTALGSITLTGLDLTLGDLVALTDLTITANTIQLLIHGDESLLASTGLFYTSPSLHFIAGGSYLQTGTLDPPSGPLNAQGLGLAPSSFEPELTYLSHLLNFDVAAKPVPPPAPISGVSERSKQYAIYLLLVADAQLSDKLPIMPILMPKPFDRKDER